MNLKPIYDPLRQNSRPTSFHSGRSARLLIAFVWPWIIATNVGCWTVVDTLDEATRQSQSENNRQDTVEQIEAAEYVDDEGNIDWRRRVDDVAESIEQATSSRRWGRETATVEAALKAARLMPPASKDFDLAQEMADTESDLDETDTTDSSDSQTDTDGDVSETPDSVTNAEVAKLRKALEDVFAALESDGVGSERGKSGKAPNYVTDAIEIR